MSRYDKTNELREQAEDLFQASQANNRDEEYLKILGSKVKKGVNVEYVVESCRLAREARKKSFRKIMKQTITNVTTVKLSLVKEDIISSLKSSGAIHNDANVKSIFVSVPGGGDWSSCNLDIDEDYPIEIVYTRSTT